MAIKTLKSWANISLHSGGADCQLFSLCSWAHTHCHRTMAITILVLYNFSRAATQHPLRELAALYFASFILLCRCHYYYLLLLGALFCCVALEKFFGLSGGAVKTPLTRSSSPLYSYEEDLRKLFGIVENWWGVILRVEGRVVGGGVAGRLVSANHWHIACV